MGWFIGVDVGGTFTDFFAFDSTTGRHRVFKTPSTPANPALAIIGGLSELAALAEIDLTTVERFSHGTTVATNALLQRKGGRVVLATTKGFKDLIEIGRQIRPKLYSLQEDQPDPVVGRENRIEVAERIFADGSVGTALAGDALDRAVAEVVARGADAVAVCFLFSFLNPAHEELFVERLKAAAPNLPVSRSSEIQPEFREYERLSTTVINAYLQPLMDKYFATLGREVGERAPKAQIGINQSSGGLMSIDRARRFPVRTALSGPAAGAVGAVHMARLSQVPDVVTLDMGGTSADICLIRGYEVGNAFDREINGFPIRLPIVDIHTIGAGGGSIAWFDRDGLVKVGPISAGAVPGPACYGKGGDRPTVSDANALLGRLGGKGLLGGRMALDLEASRRAFAPLAERLGVTPERAAQGVIAIVNSNMVRAIRVVSVERGHDPRDLALMPFGGAGGLHASGVARALGIRRLLVPLMPGILCAQGLIVSDIKEDFVRTLRKPVSGEAMDLIATAAEALGDQARAWFAEESIAEEVRALSLLADLRYVGQNYELPVAIDRQGEGWALGVETLLERFYAAHERSYGFHSTADPVELVNLRLTARGALRQPDAPQAAGRASGAAEPVGERLVYFDEETPLKTSLYDRDRLLPGHRIHGPAIIDQMDATTVLYPGDEATVDDALNLIVEVAP